METYATINMLTLLVPQDALFKVIILMTLAPLPLHKCLGMIMHPKYAGQVDRQQFDNYLRRDDRNLFSLVI